MKELCFPDGVEITPLIPNQKFKDTLFVVILNGTKENNNSNENGWLYCVCIKKPHIIKEVHFSLYSGIY